MEAVILECGDFPKKEYPRELLRRADVIICCDRALDTFLRHRDKIFKDLRDPDAIIGDMDSISPKHLKEYSRIAIREEEQETNDQTKAFRYLLEHWPEVKTVHILGATGKREATPSATLDRLWNMPGFTEPAVILMKTEYMSMRCPTIQRLSH